MTPTEREVLRETLIGARWLIREPRLWVTGVSSVGERRCAYEAIEAVTELFCEPSPVRVFVRRHLRVETGPSIADWQDERTHAEVLALFDRAIAGLK